jgi:phosphatidylglycerophosphate synthase
MLRAMVDRRLRALKHHALAPAASRLAPRLRRRGALPITAVALGVGVAAALAAAAGAFAIALALWLASRVLDGLDGEVARRLDRADDVGGYVDLLADYVVYASVPIGAAVGVTAPWNPLGPGPSPWIWPAAAALLATYYVNLGSYAVLAALMEKRGRAARARGESTAMVMPAGLVEGFETIVLVTLMLAFPAQLAGWFVLTAVLVAATAGQRVAWAWRWLRNGVD